MTNITQLLNQIDPLSTLEQDVLNVLTEFMDDYLTDLIKKVCELAQHRGSKNIETKDIEFAINRYFK